MIDLLGATALDREWRWKETECSCSARWRSVATKRRENLVSRRGRLPWSCCCSFIDSNGGFINICLTPSSGAFFFNTITKNSSGQWTLVPTISLNKDKAGSHCSHTYTRIPTLHMLKHFDIYSSIEHGRGAHCRTTSALDYKPIRISSIININIRRHTY